MRFIQEMLQNRSEVKRTHTFFILVSNLWPEIWQKEHFHKQFLAISLVPQTQIFNGQSHAQNWHE